MEAHGRKDLLIDAGMALSSELSLDRVLQRIVDLAVEVTGARYGALGVLDEDAERIREFVTSGVSPEERAAIGDPPEGQGILGLLIRESRPIRIPDISADPRAFGFPPNHPPMRSFLGAPVRSRGTVFGNLYLTEKLDAAEFDADDERALVVLAAQAGIAIENARLYEEAGRQGRRLAVLEDRERIAKELHDGAIQALFAVGMGLQGVAGLSGDEEVAKRIEDAVAEIDSVIRDLRNYIFGLRPDVLSSQRLDQALRDIAQEFRDRTDVVTILDVDALVAGELEPRADDVVQLTREALSNVARHAEAATCRVSLYRRDGEAVLEIDDDGRGFDAAVGRERGQGLANLRARSEGVGGRLEIRSSAREGTTVRVQIPLGRV